MSLVCNGQAHCPDGSDKWMCTQNSGCLPGDWTCRNKLCIPIELRCNGRNDCGDDSDEEACGPCGDPRLRCPDGVCLTASERCDGITQCSDARDEPASCGKKCSERNGGCSHACVDQSAGAECQCPAGMVLSTDGVNCEGNATKLLTTRKRAIGLLNLKTRQIENLYTADQDPVAITYDLARGSIYWADDQGRIFKAEGQRITTLYQGQMGIGSLACDWLNGHVYWTSAKTQTVYAGSSDGNGVAVVIAKGGTPLDLVLLPTERNMFWINKGQNGELSIEKASMDGYKRSSLAIITAELPRGLTLDVASRRLYWISDFKMSIETVKCDGSGRYTFWDVFKGRAARALSVFEGLFYWADEKFLWQIDPKDPKQSNFIVKATSPHMTVYHSLQQPHDFKLVYATPTNIYMLEFAKNPPVKTSLLTTTEDIESFDISWRAGSIIWINGTGHLKGQWLSGGESVYIPTPGPVCLVRVDQQTGNLIWRSCDGFTVGVTAVSLSLPDHSYTKTLYVSWRGVKDLYVDWKRGRLYWLETACVHRLQIVSLLKMKKYSLGKSWSVQGDIEAVSEPFIVSYARNVITLWGRKDGAWVTETPVEKGIVGVVVAELELMSGQTSIKVSREQSCRFPSVLCEGTSLCISQTQLCDGRRDCPDGADEQGCVKSCFNTAHFLCKDRRKCIERNLVCDGRSHCFDGSDEVGCPTVATKISKTTPLKCRLGSKACRDGSECVLHSHVCDGEKDCRDGSDEDGCDLCQEGQFQCANGRKCIDQKQVCDGTPQCPDRSDELDCWVPTKSCALRCDGQSRCIPQVFICNGVQDCWDSSDEAGCAIPPPAPRCDGPSVLCEGTSLCIAPDQLCDGRKDCPDGWDEKACLSNCPKRGQYLCRDRRKCIEKRLICDGRAHCFDGSDEVGCPNVYTKTSKTTPLKCHLASKACRDGTECVLHSHVCDGEKDCRDGSDEEGCDLRCKPGQFQCAHGSMCIDQKQVCDGTPQCQDRSDELDCFKATKGCSHRCDNKTRCIPEGFLCDGEKDCTDGTDEANCGFPTPAPTPSPCRFPSVLCEGTSLCISQTQLCDGRRDCPDGADEQGCVDTCSDPAHFLCKDKRKCVERNLVCDGRSHCFDGSDEVGCPTVATKISKTTPLKCRLGSKACRDGSECVLHSHVCNGEKDCRDGSDEEGCDPVCKPGQFQCFHGSMCIDQKQVCDGTPQCQDRSDELDCFKATKSCSHRCDKTRCIPEHFLCDGERDCLDGTDEANCLSKLTVTSSGHFLCKDRRKCVERNLVCDGRSHCFDGSDEVGCPTVATKISKTTPLKCRLGSKACRDGSECVLHSHVCDGEKDCRDGSDEDGCDLACKPGQFQCAHGSMCIDQKQVCDGTPQCQDRSDELDCFKASKSCSHRCDEKTRCIPQNFVCDGERDCLDGTDEANCSDERDSGYKSRWTTASPLKCRLGSKACRDGTECVLYSHVCDGEKDCRDGSDEDGCDLTCKPGQFQCAHGRMCIDQKQVCDGTPQCQDRSDELDCFKATKSCSHRCDNKTRCIPEGFLCDGEKDCTDGSDEANCVVEACGSDQFQCGNGQCVDQPLRCDGHADCRDHSDEKGCSQPPTCPPQLRCPGSDECLLQEWLCDGDEDCSDGSDERNCKTSLLKCGEMQWACSSKDQCIPQSWRCDGTNDCHDHSDETGCGQVKCLTGKFPCRSGECVDLALVCNGATNCLDSSDEGPGCAKSNCTSSGSPRCDHTCVQTPHGARCMCKAGFRLQADGLTCKDVDECKESGPPACSHICLNSRGSFLCQCSPGFLLEPDGRTCKTPDEPSLLASMQSELVLLGLRSGDKKVLMAPGKKPIFSVDYDWLEQRVYWVSLDEASIKWAAHEQKYLGTLVAGVKSDSIALDWVGRNLYWVDGVAGQILAVRLSPTVVKPENYTVILDEDLEQPRSLALLPQRGLMFWSEIGSEPQIERSGMDGSDRRLVVSKSLSWPVSVTIDLLEERVYWTDERLKCIGSASLTGENIKLLQLPETPSPFSVAVFNDMVYWSDTKRRTIQGASKVNGKNRKVILKRPSQPFGLKAVHPLLQAVTSNPCERLHCSHLCLLAPGPQAVCHCPAGLLLAGDGLACSPPTDSSSSFLLMLSPTTVTQIYLRGLRGAKDLKKWPEHRALLLPRMNEAMAMDMVMKERLLYLSDAGLASVSTLKLSGSSLTQTRHLLQLPGDVVTALAVDWVTQNLYWSSRAQPAVHVTTADGRYTTELLVASGHTISIALHPPTGRMCFTATGRAGGRGKDVLQVECAFMDGANRTVLWADAAIATSLTFSNKGSQLYWADIGKGVIASIGIDGSKYREYKTGPDLIVSFTCTDNILLWVTLDNDVTKMWYSDGFQPKQLWFEVKTNVVEVKAYSRSSQKGGNACSVKNGGCVHLCLAHPSGRTCMCSHDHLTNGSECMPQHRCTDGSKACWDGTCLPSAKFCDRVLDCPDGSDEKNCLYDKPAIQPTVGVEKPRRPRPLGNAHPKAMGMGDRRLEVGTCAEEHCSGHGTCVSRDGEVACKCSAGYSGDSCQDAGSTNVGVILALLLVVACVVIAVLVIRKRRQSATTPEKATLMTNMEGRNVHMEGFTNNLYNADEEEVTPADVPSL
ncbi:uncharacterized protein lrp13b [Alosa pseudoharengus]|uniref:uncharacterized protein lrp13b n=1 Tax=Alosa pseudoharengus TaxID=34774 RepID=UPI003F8A75A0